jgi:hypothetical protein
MVLIIRFKSITNRSNKAIDTLRDFCGISSGIKRVDNFAKTAREIIEMLVVGVCHLLKYVTE